MLAIYKKEIGVFFNSLMAYLVIGVFLILCGLIFWVFRDSNALDYGFAEMNSFFTLVPYVFLFLIPALSMKMFSEEYRLGTMELLFTKPISKIKIIWAKYLAVFSLVILALIPTVIYYISLYLLGNPVGNIDSAAVVGSYIGLILLAGVFTAIGIFSSTLTNNQIVAFLIAAALSYFLFDGITQLATLIGGKLAYYVAYLGVSYHYEALSRGLIDSRNLVYFLSIILLMIILSEYIVRKKSNV